MLCEGSLELKFQAVKSEFKRHRSYYFTLYESRGAAALPSVLLLLVLLLPRGSPRALASRRCIMAIIQP